MKSIQDPSRKSLALLMAMAVIFPTVGDAATKLSDPKTFKNGDVKGFNVTSRGWSDLNFVGQGWTHNSQFGQVKLRKRQTLSIKVISADPSLHPGSHSGTGPVRRPVITKRASLTCPRITIRRPRIGIKKTPGTRKPRSV